MITHLDNLLRHLFIATIDEITDETQVRFQPPDEDWRAYVSNLIVDGQPANALNVYMIDMRENRKLRSNERTRDIQNGTVIEIPAPFRLDCHYVITAWSPAQVSQAVEPAVDEHALLYKATAALTNNEPLVPRMVYAPNPLPETFPKSIADAELPTALLPVEGFPKYAEFWGTMGVNHRWKPAIYLTVTLPVIYASQIAGPMVTKRTSKVNDETWVQIAGRIFNPVGESIPDALVDILDTGLRTTSDSEGRYSFVRVPVGTRNIRVVAVGFQPETKPVLVPGVLENYDITLTPL
ncbi:hypothetical protein Noc_1875 [Nitrosococcus oceani ATCC 19707]|uniref:Pvc16 N-terminal domain-containing protein n=2 Tax=Nitrosococcus oceani TaxID=1229 RepID=Q3JA05_NITOC|nr:Pvc16 family protein [Nitrosococcus oceani]ABA58341.1 hypothetical protein Noc_1875 [Nitrosococcus oceani ATCC 19707]EDZ66847.1 hypothetical protein NOC27_174 [Nitrosococcus oceani AFC27]KFI19270.1 hypothetical protein IB75_09990 [Nitrosococcus oceani C-27]GEM18730.1 hypothetical protein NONS58_00870 [Nitrosococcus oceani]